MVALRQRLSESEELRWQRREDERDAEDLRVLVMARARRRVEEMAERGEPQWLAERPPFATAAADRWERRRHGLIGKVAAEVRREMEEEDRLAWAAAEKSGSSGSGSDSSDTDRDTNFNLVSSPALPVSQAAYADRLAQAEFEDAVGDGSYQADPDFDWEPAAVGETKQGCS